LVGGQRVSKADKRIESYGTIDELNSFIGLLMTELTERADLDFLTFVQHKLFSIGSYLATDRSSTALRVESRVTAESITCVEEEIDRIDGALPKMTGFVLPGGNRPAALAHVCRTVCRRAERLMYGVDEADKVDDYVLMFINRLSDYLFVLARKACINNNGKEILWDYLVSKK
jgi:cob(I)alamin adenosyltransferase